MSIRHIVLWKFKEEDPVKLAAFIAEMKVEVEALAEIIPQVHNLKVTANHPDRANTGDAVLEAEFDNFEDMQTYLTHPDHVAAVGMVRPLVASGLTVDYEF